MPTNSSESPQLVSPFADNGIRLAWILGLTSLGLLLALAAYLSPLKPNLVVLQFSFSPSAFQAVLDAWQPEGVFRFRTHLPIDYGLMLCYGAFGWVLASKTAVFTHFSSLAQKLLRWTMPVAALMDAAENALHWQLTSGGATMDARLYLAAGLSATLKSALLLVFLTCFAVALTKRRKVSP